MKKCDDAPSLRCMDQECRQYEQQLCRTLFQWKHFPVDMVVEPFIRVPLAIRNGLALGIVFLHYNIFSPCACSATGTRLGL